MNAAPVRTLTRSAVRALKRRIWAEKRDTALVLPSIRSCRAQDEERRACARRVADLMDPIRVPVDEAELIRNARLAVLRSRLRRAVADLAKRRFVCRELAQLAAHPDWERFKPLTRAHLQIEVKVSGKTAAQAYADLSERVALKVAA